MVPEIGILSVVFSLLWLFPLVHGLKVFKNILDLTDPSPVGGARVVGPYVEDMTDITLCIRFYFQMLGRYEGKSHLISIEDWRESDAEGQFRLLWFGANYPFTFFGFGYPQMSSYLLQEPVSRRYDFWIPNKWTHVCLSFQKNRNYLRMVKDGGALNIDFEDPLLKNLKIPSDFLNKTYIGRCPYDFKGGCSNPGGMLSDFNIWDRALTEEQMRSWTTCKSLLKGNVLNWDQGTFQLENMIEEDVPLDLICRPLRPGHVHFPEEKNLVEALDICFKMRAQISVVTSEMVQNELIALYNQTPNVSKAGRGFFGGWWDTETEGTFTNINNGDILRPTDFQPWYFGEPNGNTLENCQTVWPHRQSWNDMSCSVKATSFCEFERPPYLQLRGLCSDSLFDAKFSWTGNLVNGRHSFNGFTNSRLFWLPNSTQWKLELLSDPRVFAIGNTTNYPFGTHQWDFSSDSCISEDANSSLVTLNFNACDPDEFNCLDGYCIPVEGRCDGRIDCSDKSDEFDCEMITIDRSYIRDIPAPPQVDQERTQINVSVDILSILEISEVDSKITLQFQLYLRWFDSRLVFSNLKEDSYLNTLNSVDKAKLWIPQAVFYNTQYKEETTDDEKAFVIVDRLGSSRPNPVQQLQNTHYYEGQDNPLTISRVYTSAWICDFDMAVYPFDTQRCRVKFSMKGNSGNFAWLQTATLRYLGPIDLTQYFVKGSSFSLLDISDGLEGLQVEIILGRRILSQILTTYLPTMLICIVSFSTNYFKPFFFEALVTVNLTSLLVLTTLFISVSDSLPKTSYIKMIDIWLLFCLLIPFFEVLLHTFIDGLRHEPYGEINHHGRSVKVDEAEKMPEVTVNSKVIHFPRVRTVSVQERATSVQHRQLVARDEKAELAARQNLYESLVINEDKLLQICTSIARKGLPLASIAFSIMYFGVGMYFRQLEDVSEDLQN